MVFSFRGLIGSIGAGLGRIKNLIRPAPSIKPIVIPKPAQVRTVKKVNIAKHVKRKAKPIATPVKRKTKPIKRKAPKAKIVKRKALKAKPVKRKTKPIKRKARAKEIKNTRKPRKLSQRKWNQLLKNARSGSLERGATTMMERYGWTRKQATQRQAYNQYKNDQLDKQHAKGENLDKQWEWSPESAKFKDGIILPEDEAEIEEIS